MFRAQAALNVSRNIAKIQEQAGAVKRVKEIIDDAKKEAEKIKDVVEELIKIADDIGSKANKEGWFTPEDICLHYHPQLIKEHGNLDLQRSRSDSRQLPK